MSNKQQHRISIQGLLQDWRDHMERAYSEAEKSKLGTLRVGSGGALYQDGRGNERVVGKCPRLAHLRSLGIQPENSVSSEFMFDGGYANEHRWAEKMNAVWPGKVKMEEEVATTWYTSNGTKVQGRPDIVLCATYTSTMNDITTAHTTPVHGQEHKNVSSLWTARDVLIKGMPKMVHLIQAAHYSWQLDIPFSLCYSSSSKYPVITKLGKTEIRWPEHDSELGQYMEYDDWGKGKFPRSLQPFVKIYDINVTPEVISYRTEGSADWIDTPVGLNGIIGYYEMVSGFGREGNNDLGPRPVQMKVDGSKASFKQCDNCPFATACDNYDGGTKRGSGDGHRDYQEWLTESSRKSKEAT